MTEMNYCVTSSRLWMSAWAMVSAIWLSSCSRDGPRYANTGGSHPSLKRSGHGGKYWSLGHSNLENKNNNNHLLFTQFTNCAK